MTWENFSSLVEGLDELSNRMDNKMRFSIKTGSMFLDSDCMDIELYDKDGNIYDYLDCVKKMGTSFIFDTVGWNPENKKHQERAEKLVNYVLNQENKDGRIRDIYVSLNTQGNILVAAMDKLKKFNLKEAHKLKRDYIERMANVLFTFSPLIKINCIRFLTRQVNRHEFRVLYLQDAILKRLKQMYKEDLNGKQKYVTSDRDIEIYLKDYSVLIKGADEYSGSEINVIGRARNFIDDKGKTLHKAQKEFLNKKTRYHAINPDGSIFDYNGFDVSAPTNIRLNFEDDGKKSRPFAFEIPNQIFIY